MERLSIPTRIAGMVQTAPFRATLAVACLAAHLIFLTASAKERFGAPFNAAPGHPPMFTGPGEVAPRYWNRLAVSRWDAGTYIGLALRGYSECPSIDLHGADLRPYLRTCSLGFYPTYSLLGRLASVGGRIPIDYALFGVSLIASFLFLFLWTGPTLVERLGLGPTYAAFLALNFFTTGFSLVTIQTEPVTLVLALGALLCLVRRWLLAGAVLAGAATAMRITALSVGAAYAVALVVLTVVERPRGAPAWARRTLEIAASGWGLAGLLVYFQIRFGDSLVYMHAHSQSFKHQASLWQLLAPKADLIALSLDHPLHEGVWLASALLWLGLGHKEALARFSPVEKIFCHVLAVVCLGVAALGSVGLAFAGMTRYLLLCLPLFFAIGTLIARNRFVLVVWLAMTAWHYWHVDLCEYTGGPGNRTLQQCHAAHWLGRI
jgi:hypothetical protein